MTETLLITAGILLFGATLLWLASVVLRDVSIIDPFWGLGFVVTAWAAAAVNWPLDMTSRVLTVLVTVWGLRLFGFLLWRNWGKPEDYRYAEMRRKNGAGFVVRSLVTVFYLQAALCWLISLPIQVSAVHHSNLFDAPSGSWIVRGMVVVGGAVWLVGFFFESVGDWQLAKFKRNPANRGKVLEQGLWRYTRHPNYFGDFCVWWGFFLIAASDGAAWTLFSPIMMSFLLMRVSGVTLLERTISERRPAYEAYRRRTNAFFPGPPRRDS